MKQKVVISAMIALIVAGLLITSAAGIQPFKTAVSDKMTAKPDIQNIIDIVKNPDNLKMFEKVEAVMEIDSSASAFQTQSKKLEMQSAYVLESSEGSYELATAENFQTRDNYQSEPKHPALATAGDGNIILGYDYYYFNWTIPNPPEEFNGQIWDASTTCAEEGFEGDGFYWVRNGSEDEPMDVSYPAIDYWGLNASTGLNQWFATFVGEEAPFLGSDMIWYNGTNVTIMRCVGDPTVSDNYGLRTWTGFGDDFFDASMADIACSDGLYFPENRSLEPFGICSYIMSNTFATGAGYPNVQGPHMFYPVEYQGENRYGLMSWFLNTDDTNTWPWNCQGASTYIDDVTKAAYCVWDPQCIVEAGGTVQGRLMIYFTEDLNDEFGYPDANPDNDGGYTWSMQSEDLDIEYPSVATQDGDIVIVMEMHNRSADQDWISFWHNPDGDCGNLNISGIWYMTDGTDLSFPEVAHVDDDTFVATMLNGEDVMFAVTYDGGVTWEGLWYWAQDYPAVQEYRTLELTGDFTGSGVMSMHEWLQVDNMPTERIYTLLYSFTTAKFEGNVWIEEEMPAENYEVWAVNMNITYPHKRVSSVYTDSDGKYTKNLILGLDVWTDSVVKWFAADNVEHKVGIGTETYDEVTGAGCALYPNADIFVDIHYRDLTDFPYYSAYVELRDENQMTGAAVIQMMLNYLMWNSTENPEGPPLLYDDQQVIFDQFASGQYITGFEMWTGLNAEIDDNGNGWIYGYFFNPAHDTSVDEVLKSICVWLDYPVNFYNDYREVDVPKPGHPNHVPVAVPLYGDYSNWAAIRGIHTDQNCWPPGDIVDLNVYGFWLNDPYNHTYGLPGRTYVTVDTFTADYFEIMNVPGDDYDGEYLAITDPYEGAEDINFDAIDLNKISAPTELTRSEARLVKYVNSHDVSERAQSIATNLLEKAAFDSVMNVVFDSDLATIFTGTQPVEVNGYTVTFEGQGNIIEVVLDANGALKQFTIA